MFTQLHFYCNIFDGQIDWANQKKVLIDELAQIKDGTQVYITIGRIPHPRTDAQLKAFFGLFASHCIAEFNDRGYDSSYLYNTPNPTGIPITKDLLKDYMYNVCPVYRDDRKLTIRSMSPEEMAEFYDNCCNFAASQWNVYIPETDKNWREKKDIVDRIKEKNELQQGL